MRVARLPLALSLLLFVGLSAPAFAIGLQVEQLAKISVNICPVCHRVIAPGRVRKNAEDIVATQFGGAFIDAGISYTTGAGRNAPPQRANLPLSGTAGGQFFRGAACERRLSRPFL